MSLADDIRTLRARALAELNDAHDYYFNTRTAWEIVENAIAAGASFTNTSRVTGSVISSADLAGKAQGYVTNELTEATFQQFISIFESFFFDLLRIWLSAHPQGLFKRDVKFQAIHEAADKDAITLLVVNKELNDLSYEKPADWFKYLEERTKVGCPTPDEIERFAEAKATRDVLVHNRGTASKIYAAKAGKLARCKLGERIDVPEDYHRAIWELLRKIVADVADAAGAKG